MSDRCAMRCFVRSVPPWGCLFLEPGCRLLLHGVVSPDCRRRSWGCPENTTSMGVPSCSVTSGHEGVSSDPFRHGVCCFENLGDKCPRRCLTKLSAFRHRGVLIKNGCVPAATVSARELLIRARNAATVAGRRPSRALFVSPHERVPRRPAVGCDSSFTPNHLCLCLCHHTDSRA